MTREEAKEKMYHHLFDDSITIEEAKDAFEMVIIDKIYDDFESRTCENCKYDNYANSRCDLKSYIPEFYLENFGCTNFKKEEKC